MWEMFGDMIKCDECGNALEPPPKFTIPPPPRPPYLTEYSRTKCNEEDMSIKAQRSWEGDICEAMPIFDARLNNSQSWQTWAIIAVFTLLLILVVLISSLVLWKNKRKVQNFLSWKPPTRGIHINGALPLGGNYAITYEDPDIFLEHHRPLVLRKRDHSCEILHGKTIHYPSGYPMTRSPPFLVSSSPGPDPYRSNDNVYEELGPGRGSDTETNPPLHSDDDFAEDELSLPEERFFNKQIEIPNAILNTNVSAIYHERTPSVSNVDTSSSNAIGSERNRVLSKLSISAQNVPTTTAVSMNSFQSNKQSDKNTNYSGSTTPRSCAGSLLPAIIRHTTGRNKFHTENIDLRNIASLSDLNASSSTTDANEIGLFQQMYDTRSNLMSLALYPQKHQRQHNQAHNNGSNPYFHSLHQLKNSNKINSRHCSIHSTSTKFNNTLENRLDRRNRMNTQLDNAATIYRERNNCSNQGRFNCPQPHYDANSRIGFHSNAVRARVPVDPIESSYGYAEPVYHDNWHYDSWGSPAILDARLVQLPISAYASSQIMSDCKAAGPAYQDRLNHNQQHITSMPTCQGNSLLYSCGDSSLGSDSGYSHHTPASSIERHDDDLNLSAVSIQPVKTGNKESTTSRISAAFGIGRYRRKSTSTHNVPTSLKVQSVRQNQLYSNNSEATSPNNNSSCSTRTSNIENTSSASSTSASGCSTASNNNALAGLAQT